MIEYIAPPEIDKIIVLAEHIKSFKTPEMEIVFAQFIKKAMNPPMIYRGDKSNE